MPLSKPQQRAADVLRLELGWGDRKISSAIDVPYGQVRTDREKRVPAKLDLQAAAANETNFKTTVIIPDVQYPWVHKASEAALMEFIYRTQPDEVLQIGDFMDLFSLARFRKKMSLEERWELEGSLQQEVELGRAKLSAWHDLAPDATYYWLEGNHEERLERYIEDTGGELMGLDVLTIETIYQTAERGWNYVGPYDTGMWIGNEGGLYAIHGQKALKYAAYTARSVLEQYAHSVIMGHTHRLGSTYYTGHGGMKAGFEVGCICSKRATPRSVQVVNWQTGFAVVYSDRESTDFWVSLINIEDGKFIYGGEKYGS